MAPEPGDVTFREISRIQKRLRAGGLDRLEAWEREALERFCEAAAPFVEMLRKQLAENPSEWTQAQALYECLSPADQERLADWKPNQLLAISSLLELVEEPEPPGMDPQRPAPASAPVASVSLEE